MFGPGNDGYLKVPFARFAADKFVNVAYLGVLSNLLGLDEAVVFQALEDYFGAKKPEVTENNRTIFTQAFDWAKSQQLPGTVKLAPALDRQERLMLNGNEAIALGAMAAGLKFCSFYPMTPATSISLTLQAAADTMGLVVEQAEDEIAAINMALGASYAGVPAMVATSGGGFALMAEGVSLAGMTETPIFIVVAQRPGPATGLPTRTEQADLEFVLHAGHGEFPRAIFAPGTVEECFHLTHKALGLAETYQTPIFLLTDQFLADSYRAVPPFELASLEPVQRGQFAWGRQVSLSALCPDRQRYLTPPGAGLERAPGGVRQRRAHQRRPYHRRSGRAATHGGKATAQRAGLRSEVAPPEFLGDPDPEVLLVTWGSSRGAVLEAAATRRDQGQRAAVLCFSQVWPLVGEQFLPILQKAKEAIMVEGNAFGQFARLIRRETGFLFPKMILRYDGLPLTPEYILAELAG